jgi:G3E family GTPase
LNKADLASPEQIDRVKEIVLTHNPEPRFIETVFCDVPLDAILAKAVPAGTGTGKPMPGAVKVSELSSSVLDDIVDSILADPLRDVTPPDVLASAVFRWTGDGTSEFMCMLGEMPKGIVRGKGFLREGTRTLLLNLTLGRVTLDKCPPGMDTGDLVGKVVLIFPPDLADSIREVARKWPKLEVPVGLLGMGNTAPAGSPFPTVC